MTLAKINGSVGIGNQLNLEFDGASQTKAQTNQNFSIPISYGATLEEDQVDKVYFEEIEIAASGSQDLNLSDGSLVDAEGNTLVFANVKVLSISCNQTSDFIDFSLSGNFLTGNNLGTANYHENSGKNEIDLRNGFTVTGTSQDLITITNNDGANPVKIRVLIAGV